MSRPAGEKRKAGGIALAGAIVPAGDIGLAGGIVLAGRIALAGALAVAGWGALADDFASPAGARQETACPYCPAIQFAPPDPLPLYVHSPSLDLVCQPARIACDEGAWTFFLRGPGILDVTGARLEAGGARVTATRLDWPTPLGLLIDFTLPALNEGGRAQLVLLGSGKELGRLPIAIAGPASVPPGQRQPDFVRLQLRDWTLFYPLHASGQVEYRKLEEIGGDESFRAAMREMGVRGVRKILSSVVEGDTVQWDERNHRENVYGSAQLRMYLAYLDPTRSQEAYREIFRAFSQVEEAWVNEDMELRRRKKYGG